MYGISLFASLRSNFIAMFEQTNYCGVCKITLDIH